MIGVYERGLCNINKDFSVFNKKRNACGCQVGLLSSSILFNPLYLNEEAKDFGFVKTGLRVGNACFYKADGINLVGPNSYVYEVEDINLRRYNEVVLSLTITNPVAFDAAITANASCTLGAVRAAGVGLADGDTIHVIFTSGADLIQKIKGKFDDAVILDPSLSGKLEIVTTDTTIVITNLSLDYDTYSDSHPILAMSFSSAFPQLIEYYLECSVSPPDYTTGVSRSFFGAVFGCSDVNNINVFEVNIDGVFDNREYQLVGNKWTISSYTELAITDYRIRKSVGTLIIQEPVTITATPRALLFGVYIDGVFSNQTINVIGGTWVMDDTGQEVGELWETYDIFGLIDSGTVEKICE
jgi:hypothetical protein